MSTEGDLAHELELDRILRGGSVKTVFQPLIDLSSGEVVGFEALSRGPAGSILETPVELFRAAYQAGRVPELDWLCLATALRQVLAAGLDPSLTLFVNTEPITMATECPVGLRATIAAAEGRLRVVVEVTERAISRDPANLLAAVGRHKEIGWGVALDDVGADPASLAVMPFIRPDVIKLDLRLIQSRTTPEVARIINAVGAQAERTGATVLAEGIETQRHADVARAMGATLGQGWLYGRPADLPHDAPPTSRPIPLLGGGGGDPAAATPYDIVTARRSPVPAQKRLLVPMSAHLEHHGLDANEPTVLLACFQDAWHFDGVRRRFEQLADRAVFTAALGAGMPRAAASGVLGVSLEPGDPLLDEWIVIVIGPHFAGALVARDHGDRVPDPERLFDVAITHDRDLVIQAGRSILARLLPDARPLPLPQVA